MSDRMQQLEALLADDPGNSFIKFAIAKEYEGLGEQETALAKYAALKEADANYVGLYYHYAKLLEKREEFEKAIAIYKEGMAIAQKQGDKHAYGEMESALWEIDDEM